MLKNKFLRFLLFALAIWIVLSLASLFPPLLLKTWNVTTSPSVRSIVAGLRAESEAERSAALDKIKHPLWFEPEIVNAVSEMALDDTYPAIQARMIGFSTTAYGLHSNMTREQLAKAEEQPVLTPQKIDKIAKLVFAEKLEISPGTRRNPIYSRLYIFLQSTINAQSNPEDYVNHIANMLDRLLKAERFYARQAMIQDAMQALIMYSRHIDMPEQTMAVLLDLYNDEKQSSQYASELVIEIFQILSSRRVFNKEVTLAVENAAINDKNNRLRKSAVMALGQQSLLTGSLSGALEAAVKDEDQDIARLASQTIARFKQEQGKQTGKGNEALLATAFDTGQQPDVRASALGRGVSYSAGAKLTIAPAFFKAAESLLNDPEPVVRVASVNYLRHMVNNELYQSRQDELRHWLETALQDQEATVRRTAVNMLEYYPDDNARRSEYIASRLKDDDAQVVLAAMRIVRIKKLNTAAINKNIEDLTHSKDTAVSAYAKRYHKRLVAENRSVIETVTLLFTDPKSRGGLLFLVAAIAAIVCAAGFSIYYAYTLVSHLLNKRKKAISSFIVLLLWAIASYALAALFVISLFGMGHNSPAPMHEQMAITYTLLGFVIAYAIAGFVMSKFVRVPKSLE